MQSDSTAQPVMVDTRDRYLQVQAEINAWRVSRRKGSMCIYFDGSGRIPRFTKTTEG